MPVPDSWRTVIAGALLNKGISLTAMGRHREAIEVYNELLARFDDDPIADKVRQLKSHLGDASDNHSS